MNPDHQFLFSLKDQLQHEPWCKVINMEPGQLSEFGLAVEERDGLVRVRCSHCDATSGIVAKSELEQCPPPEFHE